MGGRGEPWGGNDWVQVGKYKVRRYHLILVGRSGLPAGSTRTAKTTQAHFNASNLLSPEPLLSN